MRKGREQGEEFGTKEGLRQGGVLRPFVEQLEII